MAEIALPARERLAGLAAAIAVQLLLGWALITGLALGPQAIADRAMKLFTVAPPFEPPPKPKPIPPPRPTPRPSGAASPPNLFAKATQVVAPVPVVRVVVPSPVVAAPIAGAGNQASAGAAPVPGPGFGAGGQGEGFGSGWGGDGDGGGLRDEQPPRLRSGRISDRDYPEAAKDAEIQGAVEVAYKVEVDGRATNCVIERSSGSTLLDDTTCRLIEQRFRFRPALDDRGRPVRSTLVESHEWVIR